MFGKRRPEGERRQYIRLESVFPVQFRLLSLDGKQFLSEWQQGFTNDIGKGGMCLIVNNLNPELAGLLKNKQAKLSLDIEMPVIRDSLAVSARPVWMKVVESRPNKYFIGLAYEEIDPGVNQRIMRFVVTKKFLPYFVIGVVTLLSLVIFILWYSTVYLVKGNKVLAEKLVNTLQESSLTKKKIKDIDRQKEALQREIQGLDSRLKAIEEEKLQKPISDPERIRQIDALLDQIKREKNSSEARLVSLQQEEDLLAEDARRLEQKELQLEKSNLGMTYQWLKMNQDPKTALVKSFEKGEATDNRAFTYDQSLAIQAFANFADFPRAKKILEFFAKDAKRIDGLFLNAYYAGDGSPAEYTVHSGPNIWLGIAILQYTQKSKDNAYLGLAEEIASAIMYLQSQDKEGGIRGGPAVTWYSTEHNLDAYAFFNMLYTLTKKSKYQEARDKVWAWLLAHTYDKTGVPIKRGKGDATIATDTYAWSVAAAGPEKLEEAGMSPEKILEFAEENCLVETSYLGPEGQEIKLKGFDFAAQRNIARGPVISSEWTAQMVLAYKIMADYYYQKGMPAKAHAYQMKADEFLSQLGNMVISSPSASGQGESCLPYATEESVDTGHGWVTPQGKSTGSVAGTAYALFAFYNYNPLELVP
jgi:cell division protein FtsB